MKKKICFAFYLAFTPAALQNNNNNLIRITYPEDNFQIYRTVDSFPDMNCGYEVWREGRGRKQKREGSESSFPPLLSAIFLLLAVTDVKLFLLS